MLEAGADEDGAGGIVDGDGLDGKGIEGGGELAVSALNGEDVEIAGGVACGGADVRAIDGVGKRGAGGKAVGANCDPGGRRAKMDGRDGVNGNGATDNGYGGCEGDDMRRGPGMERGIAGGARGGGAGDQGGDGV